MKKHEQKIINDEVLCALDIYSKSCEAIISKKRLRTCSAIVIETENYYLLRSYNTLIAMVHKPSGHAYDFLRWAYVYTATSAQHISKFLHDYDYISLQTYRPI